MGVGGSVVTGCDRQNKADQSAWVSLSLVLYMEGPGSVDLVVSLDAPRFVDVVWRILLLIPEGRAGVAGSREGHDQILFARVCNIQLDHHVLGNAQQIVDVETMADAVSRGNALAHRLLADGDGIGRLAETLAAIEGGAGANQALFTRQLLLAA